MRGPDGGRGKRKCSSVKKGRNTEVVLVFTKHTGQVIYQGGGKPSSWGLQRRSAKREGGPSEKEGGSLRGEPDCEPKGVLGKGGECIA